MNSLHHINDDFPRIETDDLPTTKYENNNQINSRLSRDLIDSDEEITRVLTTENANESKNSVVFSYHDKQFVPIGNNEPLFIHYSYEGNMIPVDSEEAKIYLQKEKIYGKTIRPTDLLNAHKTNENPIIKIEESNENLESSQVSTIDDEDERRTNASDMTEQSDINEPIDDFVQSMSQIQNSSPIETSKKILNRFNFCEQGIQTQTAPKKDVTTLTDAIPLKKFVGLANQRIIYQEYLIDFQRQQREKDKRKQKVNYGGHVRGLVEKKSTKIDRVKSEGNVKRHQVQILKLIERILNQNRFHELIYNFKYFEDTTDETHEPMGTLFPLWKFPSSIANRSVTALTWNSTYPDMLIIGYGLYSQSERIQGALAVFTLNNSYPDTLIHTESTVLSIDCLPSKPYLVCVGLMDGDVIVYDISIPSGRAVFINKSYMCKHFGYVWQVRWCESSDNQHPRFCSAGSDGKIMRWTCIKGELRQVLILELPSAMKETRLDDETVLNLPGPALALDFHRKRKDSFLVGTEDGKIYKGSINDPGIIETMFDAHDFAIYSIQWSPFHSNVFASCSADGTVKIWHENIPECLMRFDLCTSLEDIGWSPYTSTTFAVAGADGKVYVFDIHANKLEPICEQFLSSEQGKSCTKIAFNPTHPILLVGDEAGQAICLKLSPNLRKKAKIRKGVEVSSTYESEVDKLTQELSRMITVNSMHDILLDQTTNIDD